MRPPPGDGHRCAIVCTASGAASARRRSYAVKRETGNATMRPTCAVPANGKRPADLMSAHALRCHCRPSADGKAKRVRPSARIPAGCKGANVTVASRRFRGGRIRAPTHGATACNGLLPPAAAMHAMWHRMTRLYSALASAAPRTTAPRVADLSALFPAPFSAPFSAPDGGAQ
jgi:hypothetical protein